MRRCDGLAELGRREWGRLGWSPCSVLPYALITQYQQWLQANPHRFHLVTLGTLHSLPTPVARRGQKSYKPEFFDALSRERDAADALRDVHGWLRRVSIAAAASFHHPLHQSKQDKGVSTGWTRKDIATELGAALSAIDLTGT